MPYLSVETTRTLAQNHLRPVQVGVLVALAIGTAYVFAWHSFVPVDALTYLAAGERLNAGHGLYELSPGDRIVDARWLDGGPLYYPPLIAVVWRPLAAVGPWTVYVWWAVTASATLAVAGWIVLRRSVAGTALVGLLFAGVAFLALLGNVTSMVLLLTMVAWYLGESGKWPSAGIILGVMAVAKPTGLPLVAWVLFRGRFPRSGLVGAIAGVAGAIIVGLAGAGIEAHLEWFEVATMRAADTQTGLSPALIAPWLPLAIMATTSIAAAFLPTRLGFVIAVAGTAFGSPAVTLGHASLLILVALVLPRLGSAPPAPREPGPDLPASSAA